jgi:hypothetical protein
MTTTAVPDPAAELRWRKTTYPAAEDLRCDYCGAQADTMHLLPSVTNCEVVAMACPDHCPVPQGYMIEVDRWYGDMDSAHSFADHIGEKVNGGMAVAMIQDRIAEFSLLPPRRTPDV